MFEEIKNIINSTSMGELERKAVIQSLLNIKSIANIQDKLGEEYSRGLSDGGYKAIMELLDEI